MWICSSRPCLRKHRLNVYEIHGIYFSFQLQLLGIWYLMKSCRRSWVSFISWRWPDFKDATMTNMAKPCSAIRAPSRHFRIGVGKQGEKTTVQKTFRKRIGYHSAQYSKLPKFIAHLKLCPISLPKNVSTAWYFKSQLPKEMVSYLLSIAESPYESHSSWVISSCYLHHPNSCC